MSKLLKKTLSPKAPAKRKRSRVVSMDPGFSPPKEVENRGAEKPPLGRPLPLGVGADATKHRTVPASSRSSAENVSSTALRAMDGSEGSVWLPYYLEADDPLTLPEPDRYPTLTTLTSRIGGPYVGFLGSVGPTDKCPQCRRAFEFISLERGFGCERHHTVPTRFRIVAKGMGFKSPLYSDRGGKVFDSYESAVTQWTAMNSAWRESLRPNGKPFVPDDWIYAKVEEQLFKHRAVAYIEAKRPLYERQKLSRSRWNNVNNVVARFLTPEFGEKDIRLITKEDVAELYLKLLDKRAPDGKTYSDSHVHDILMVFREILLKYLPHDDVPEFPPHGLVPKNKKQWLAQAPQMKVDACLPEKYRLAVAFLQFTSMRENELRALQVGDFVDGVLMVWKAFSDHKDENGKMVVKLCRKAGDSVSYSLPLDMCQALQSHIQGKTEDDFIFTHENGEPFGQNCMPRAWKKACKDAGVRYIPLQMASRHSKASQIMAEYKRRATEEIQRQLGHTNPVTQKKYVLP